MARKAETKWIKDIKGYSDRFNVGSAPVLTNQLSNVKIRHGRVFGRGGMTKYPVGASAAAADIIGLFNYRQADGGHILVRMQPTSVQWLNSGTWTDITGTALTGTVSTRPQYALVDDSGAGDAISLLFTNGIDLPRYWSGSGNTASIASGNSPYGKGTFYYLGYVFLTNVSDDGTFTDVFDGHRTGRYSDDWNTTWGDCTQDLIVLDETPGSWDASVVLGRAVIACKSDGFVLLRHTTGLSARFSQELMTDKVGILSALTLQKLDETSAICLGTDNTLLLLQPSGVKSISYDELFNLIKPAVTAGRLHLSRSAVNHDEKTYYFFYDRTGLTNQLLDSYVGLHYAGREFTKGELGKNVIAAEAFKTSDSAAVDLVVSSEGDFVEEFDAGKDDDGTAIVRTWQSGWQKFNEEGWLHGVRMYFAQSGTGKVRVDVAVNFGEFRSQQTFPLKGGSPSDDFVEVTYRMPTPVLCETANVRIQLVHTAAATTTELQQIGFELSNTEPTANKKDRGAEA
jgi:hypothetical protein